MNKVQKQILENVVQPAIDKIPLTRMGTIDDFNSEANLASVIIEGYGMNERYKRYRNVPLLLKGGAKEFAPMPGDTVVLEFLGNNNDAPMIVGKAHPMHDMFQRYTYEVHSEAGGGISDLYYEREDEEWS